MRHAGRRHGIWRAVVAALLLHGLAATASPATEAGNNQQSKSVDIDRIMRGMTLEEKVGQLLMVGFGGTRVNSAMVRWVQQRRVGGVALFSRNIVDAPQTMRFTRDLQALARGGVPIFVALDQEGGNVVRLKEGAMPLPGNMVLGATRSPLLAYAAGQALGGDLRRLGFNMNFAPVLDVNSNPQNPVIGVRAYGESARLVATLGAWFVRGQQGMEVATVAKHFPGHGDTATDSHFALPSLPAGVARLEEIELVPFRQAIGAGLDAIMTAHIALPRLAEDPEMPATLSHRIIASMLRERLGFQGVVITDGLEMQGIVDRYGSGRAAVMAIKAGADMPMVLWTPEVKEEVYQSLLDAARSGEISIVRLDASVRRILQLKLKRGLFAPALAAQSFAGAANVTGNAMHRAVAERIARQGITLVRNHGDVLPLRTARYRKVVVLAPRGPFAERLGQEANVKVVPVAAVPSRQQREQDVRQALAWLEDADLMVLAVYNRYHLDMAQALVRHFPAVPSVLVSFASPYVLSALPDVDGYVCAYSYLDLPQQAAADAVLGGLAMRGRLPVTIPGFYAYGHIDVAGRMAAGLPAPAGL